MTAHRIPGLSEFYIYLYMEDDMIPIQAFQRDGFYDALSGMIKAHLTDADPGTVDRGRGAWSQAKGHSLDLLAERFGPRIFGRKAEGSHFPLLLRSCLMKEVEHIFADAFRHTVRAGNTNNDTGSQRLQFLTMAQGYAIDRGAAVNVGHDSLFAELHTNEASQSTVAGVELFLCQLLQRDVTLLNVQVSASCSFQVKKVGNISSL